MCSAWLISVMKKTDTFNLWKRFSAAPSEREYLRNFIINYECTWQTFTKSHFYKIDLMRHAIGFDVVSQPLIHQKKKHKNPYQPINCLVEK